MLSEIFSSDEQRMLQEDLFDIPEDLHDWSLIRERGLVIFGAGLHGRAITEALLREGIQPDWIIDNNSKYWNTTWLDIKILPATSLRQAGNRFVLLTGGFIREMRNECLRAGIRNYLLPRNLPCSLITGGSMGLTWREMDENTQLAELSHLWGDETSKEVYKNYLSWQLTCNNKYFKGYNWDDVYFPRDLPINYNYFVDVGAFDGDTLRDWIKKTNFVYEPDNYRYDGFEPGALQVEKMKMLIEKLPDCYRRHIHIHEMALGNQQGQINLSGELCSVALGASAESESGTFNIDRLDSVLQGQCPTVIKADVEGSELALLEGALATIKRCRPSLAISIYHKPADFYELPLWIHNLNLGYKLYMRHYHPVFSDTVCYALPE